jgi:hypothetical protein
MSVLFVVFLWCDLQAVHNGSNTEPQAIAESRRWIQAEGAVFCDYFSVCAAAAALRRCFASAQGKNCEW